MLSAGYPKPCTAEGSHGLAVSNHLQHHTQQYQNGRPRENDRAQRKRDEVESA